MRKVALAKSCSIGCAATPTTSNAILSTSNVCLTAFLVESLSLSNFRSFILSRNAREADEAPSNKAPAMSLFCSSKSVAEGCRLGPAQSKMQGVGEIIRVCRYALATKPAIICK